VAKSSNIETKRLFITPFSEKHVTPMYLSWLNDAELMRFSEQRHKKHSISSCKTYLRSFDNTANFFWAIEEQDNGLGHIGNINAYVDIHNKVADIGILIGEVQAQKQGYGLEAWQAVMSFLFKNIEIRKVTAGTVSANLSMIKLMKNQSIL